MAQVAQRLFIILNLRVAFFVNCLDCQDQHGLSFIAPAAVSGFFIFFSKVWHIFLSCLLVYTFKLCPFFVAQAPGCASPAAPELKIYFFLEAKSLLILFTAKLQPKAKPSQRSLRSSGKL